MCSVKEIIWSAIVLLSISTLSAQCPPSGYIFDTQQKIDAFSANFPNCTTIEDLFITSSQGEITNLNGLSQIVSVGNNLNISDNLSLTSLEGIHFIESVSSIFIENNIALTSIALENLESVDDLYIINNPSLLNLDGLSSLTTVEFYLRIRENSNLLNLHGLENLSSVRFITILANPSLENILALNNLTEVKRDLIIRNNQSLTSLNGLENITTIGRSMVIAVNSGLQNLIGFNNLTAVNGSLQILENSSITDLTGLNNLTNVGGVFNIVRNDNLANLNGLDLLSSINGTLNINQNDNLEDIEALSNLTSMSNSSIKYRLSVHANPLLTSLSGLENINPNNIEEILIHSNTSLTICNILSVCSHLSVPSNSADIYGNANGCNTRQEIFDQCILNSEDIQLGEMEILIYPNPASEKFYVTNFNNEVLEILDIQGRLVKEVKSDSNEFSITDLENGTYFIRFYSENQLFIKTLVKN